MAKTKISELEQKYSVDRKELIDFLTEKGYELTDVERVRLLDFLKMHILR